MPRFFVRKNAVFEKNDGGKYIKITDSDARHISRSLRMAPGERIVVCDMGKTEYQCRITFISQDAVTAEVLSEKDSDTETPYRAVVYHALIKGEKMDSVIQKSVESGVYEIIPVITERCVASIAGDSVEKKLARWQRIAGEAAKQCGRGIIPEIKKPVRFDEAVRLASMSEVPLFCYEGDGTEMISSVIRKLDAEKKLRGREFDISVLIGPEGGFSVNEARSAASAGMIMTGLGKRILRTETAASFVLACMVYEFEE